MSWSASAQTSNSALAHRVTKATRGSQDLLWLFSKIRISYQYPNLTYRANYRCNFPQRPISIGILRDSNASAINWHHYYSLKLWATVLLHTILLSYFSQFYLHIIFNRANSHPITARLMVIIIDTTTFKSEI